MTSVYHINRMYVFQRMVEELRKPHNTNRPPEVQWVNLVIALHKIADWSQIRTLLAKARETAAR